MKTPLGAVLQGVLQALTRHQSRASRTSYDLVKRVHHSCAMSHDFAHPEGVIRKYRSGQVWYRTGANVQVKTERYNDSAHIRIPQVT